MQELDSFPIKTWINIPPYRGSRVLMSLHAWDLNKSKDDVIEQQLFQCLYMDGFMNYNVYYVYIIDYCFKNWIKYWRLASTSGTKYDRNKNLEALDAIISEKLCSYGWAANHKDVWMLFSFNVFMM